MELKKCREGHYYDGSIHSECPTCRENRMNGGRSPEESFFAEGAVPGQGMSGGETMPLTGSPSGKEAGGTMPLGGTRMERGGTMPLGGTRSQDVREGETVAIIQKEMGIDPVVGWLVSLTGSERGRDYRIHSDNNFVGRGEQMDICIRGDETISRVNHAVISYDTQERLFYFSRGDGRSIVRLNGKAMLSTAELMPYDIIEIGKTKLVFIPLCGERFEWEDEE